MYFYDQTFFYMVLKAVKIHNWTSFYTTVTFKDIRSARENLSVSPHNSSGKTDLNSTITLDAKKKKKLYIIK